MGDLGSMPGLGRSPGEGNGNSLQHSCLENPMDRGAWWATVHGVAKSRKESDTTEQLPLSLSKKERIETAGNVDFLFPILIDTIECSFF